MEHNPLLIGVLLPLYYQEEQRIFGCPKITSPLCDTLQNFSKKPYKKCLKNKNYNSSSLRS